MAEEARPGRRRDGIEHIIVLMMENRSFDHLIGYVDHDNPQFPNLNRIRPPASCVVDPGRPEGEKQFATPAASYVLGTDPDHSHQAVMLQMFGRAGTPGVGMPTMSGFIASYRKKIRDGSLQPQSWWVKAGVAVLTGIKTLWRWLRRRPNPIASRDAEIMKCFPESQIPVMASLVKEFAVMVNWHASVPGETWPNRQYAHAATSHGTSNIVADFYHDQTIFELLGSQQKSWEIYQDGVAQVWAYSNLWRNGVQKFHGMSQLFHDIAKDTLPHYAFIEPNHGYGRGEGNSQHPSHNTVGGDSFLAGEALMARIYNSLRARPTVFAKTLFLITYDEHGGFFDHVPPKPVEPPDDITDPVTGFDFTLSGVRVPAVAISPLIPQGTVDETFYEHASIPATVRRQFVPDAEPLSRRDAGAEDLLDHLPLLAEPRTDLPFITVGEGSTAEAESRPEIKLDDFQASLIDLAGAVRLARERIGLESAGPTTYVPDPSTQLAAASRTLIPGSRADQVVEDVVADFEREIDGPDEFGDQPFGGL